jgi:tellurite resistance protein TehA-like permease
MPYSPPQLPAYPRATLALILGILSAVGVGVLGPLAWYFGAVARREIEREPGRWQGRGQATAGLVLGIIGSALLVLFLIVLLLIVTGIALTNGYDSGYPQS